MEESLLRLPDVIKLVGYSRPTIYLKISRGEFPRPVSLGARAVAWKRSVIRDWIDSREETKRPEQAAASR